VFLDHVAIAAAPGFAATRLGSDAEFPFLAVQFEGHGASIRAVRGLTVPKCLCEKARNTLAKRLALHRSARTGVEPNIHLWVIGKATTLDISLWKA
jgi:hypothetical protein